ncbi:GNAT family N-acetyltransferase [Hyphomonas sp.]|uniref:GNAT family N-acetyltransferase n=1 Tax=Hyphomonas sp. TaxID=87 RepID=UPI00356AA9D2
MIHLRDMQIGEFSDCIAYFIPDYAEEISANYNEAIGAARARAAREVKADLPLGVDTPGQVLLCMVRGDEDDAPVGYLWCKPEETVHREARSRVAADNEKAQRLYLTAGYRATGINMRKSICG